MPSTVIGQPYASGAVQIVSGCTWSGSPPKPVGGIQLLWQSPIGNIYIALSGGGPPLSGGFMTINSGQLLLSGGVASGLLDGMAIPPGGGYFIPRLGTGQSGGINVYALADATASGVGRLFWEIF